MFDKIQKFGTVIAIVALLVGGMAFIKAPEMPDIQNLERLPDGIPAGQSLGAVGNKLAEQYDTYIKYNAGYKTQLPFNLSGSSATLSVDGTLTANGTTTLAKSFDGFSAGGAFTISTSTGAQTLYTNGGGPIICETAINDLVVIDDIGSFIGAMTVSIGTSTDSTLPNELLLASTTIATTTNALTTSVYHQIIAGVTAPVTFILDGGESIVGILADGDGGITVGPQPSASSTDFSKRTLDYGISCRNVNI